jgi:hypothetical protein
MKKILRPYFFSDITQHMPVVVHRHCVASHKSKDLTYTIEKPENFQIKSCFLAAYNTSADSSLLH